ARFEATRFVDKGQGDYAAIGTLTIRGTSRPVTLPFHLTLAGDTARAAGRVGLVRTEFGVGQGAWASGQWVALDVGVEVDIVATARPAVGH
ncbi:MAG: YceI family protein, partial [Acidobacteria bacterium]|nr:YceI family protein [Acidobacteriota bacterium]